MRNKATTAKGKSSTYAWYGIEHPRSNIGANQTCELDHFISLELGGADTLDNIWPQCGPPGVQLKARYFKQKDTVENYLAYMVKSDQMDLSAAQQGIASDWTQYIDEARRMCPGEKCPMIKALSAARHQTPRRGDIPVARGSE